MLLLALLAASVAPDILDTVYFLLGVCSPYGLFSHTLYVVALQATVLGGVSFLATGSRATALTFAGIVLLHLPADLITGHKLVIPGGDLIGLHLYAHAILDWVVETPVALLGWWLLRRSGQVPPWAASRRAAVVLVILQTAVAGYALTHVTGVKPSACFSLPIAVTGGHAGLVSGR